MRLDELARRIGGEVAGDPSIEITRVVPPEEAGPGTIVVLSDPRQIPAAEAARAAVILSQDSPPTSSPGIRVRNARVAFALALRALMLQKAPPPGVHPTGILGERVHLGAGVSVGPYAVIADDVTLGDRVQVHAHAVIEDHVQIGPDCVLHPHVAIRHGCTLGARVVLQTGTVIGSDGFGYAQDGERRHIPIPQVGTVALADDVEIGANSAVDRATLGVTRIGRGSKLDNFIHIAHNVEVGEDVAMAAACFVAGSTTIGNRVLIGGSVAIGDHIKIGDDAVVLGDSAIPTDIPPGAVVAGHPAWPRMAQRRAEAAFQRLPEVVQQLRKLEQRVRQLEGG